MMDVIKHPQMDKNKNTTLSNLAGCMKPSIAKLLYSNFTKRMLIQNDLSDIKIELWAYLRKPFYYYHLGT